VKVGFGHDTHSMLHMLDMGFGCCQYLNAVSQFAITMGKTIHHVDDDGGSFCINDYKSF
jgi:hypothetical protein